MEKDDSALSKHRELIRSAIKIHTKENDRQILLLLRCFPLVAQFVQVSKLIYFWSDNGD